jgi:hypothetical protein
MVKTTTDEFDAANMSPDTADSPEFAIGLYGDETNPPTSDGDPDSWFAQAADGHLVAQSTGEGVERRLVVSIGYSNWVRDLVARFKLLF